MPMDDESSKEMTEVMELIQMGRTSNLTCPWCKGGPLQGKPSAYGTRFTCPTCKRSYEAGKKFCAFDGEELVPLPLALGAGDPGGAVGVAFAGGLGKICPNCSRRYESDATFCGRDGEELVPVN